MVHVPTLEEIRKTRAALGDMVVTTPVVPWKTEKTDGLFGARTEIILKLELFQKTGTFKPRGALTVMMNLSPEQLKKGVTAVSAGNHAIAVAYAAKVLGVSAKIVMKVGANQFRIDKVKALGAEIMFAKDFHVAFDEAERLQKEEGRTFVHPFEGPYTFLGTATCGLEFAEQAPNLDALILGVGGGGLASGVSTAFKHLQPECRIFGIEPFGADTMWRSFQSGKPEEIPAINTIADSLGAPMSREGGVALCRQNIEDIIRIEDKDMITAMKLLFEDAKLALEPAAAAATAALMGPLNKELKGQRIGILICGSNISARDFCALISQ
ncbi:MAG TPA: pyridoxal-phosphate dependent enzyme [Sphingomonadales bacterium]|nr:pyridoxal-phosphate dependent enzyme [Sphingomonadales bacterium]